MVLQRSRRNESNAECVSDKFSLSFLLRLLVDLRNAEGWTGRKFAYAKNDEGVAPRKLRLFVQRGEGESCTRRLWPVGGRHVRFDEGERMAGLKTAFKGGRRIRCNPAAPPSAPD